MKRRTKTEPNTGLGMGDMPVGDPLPNELIQAKARIIECPPKYAEVCEVIVDHLGNCETHRLGRVEAEMKKHCPPSADVFHEEMARAVLSNPDDEGIPNYGDTKIGIMMAVQDRFPGVAEKLVYESIKGLCKESRIWADDEESMRIKDQVWRLTAKGSSDAETPTALNSATQLSNATSGKSLAPPVETRVGTPLQGGSTASQDAVVGDPLAPSQSGGRDEAMKPTRKMHSETVAMVLLIEHRDWTNVEIAKAAGINRTTLYEFPRFKKLRNLLKEQRHLPSDRRKGRTGKPLPDTEADT